MPERLQKYLARLGLGSRRQIETWIREGRLRIDGQPAVLGCQVEGHERIHLDGRPIAAPADEPPPCRVLLYHKPEGKICSRSDPEGRRSVFESLPRLAQGRWIAIGRLDLNTQGLMLFTNDGELAHRMMHPSSELEREYAVRVLGQVDEVRLTQLREGVTLEDGPGRFDRIVAAGGQGANQWYHVVVGEGRNRLVRRLWAAVECQVSRLIRIRFGPIELPRDLPFGRARSLPLGPLNDLRRAVALAPVKPKPAATSSGRPRNKRADAGPRDRVGRGRAR